MTTINNPSAFSALKIYSQSRKREQLQPAPAPVVKPRETREQLVERGSEVLQRRQSTSSGTKIYPTPRWQMEGDTSLAEWVTKQLEKFEPTPAPISQPRRVSAEWETNLQPFASVAPHGSLEISLSENKRFVIECVEDVVLQVNNSSHAQTIRLLSRDKKGETAHVAFIGPAREFQNAGTITAGKQDAAVIELMPA